MSGEAHATGPPEIDDDPRPFDVTPYSGVWWAGSPYRSFKDFMEHMNRNDAGLFRTSVCTAIVDEGENYPNYVCGQHDFRSEMTFLVPGATSWAGAAQAAPNLVRTSR